MKIFECSCRQVWPFMHFLYTALEIAYTAHFILTNVSWLSFLEVMHIFKRGWSFFSTGTCQDGKNIVSVPGYICSTFVRFVIKIHVCIYKYYFIIFMRKIYNVKCLWNTHTNWNWRKGKFTRCLYWHNTSLNS